MPINILLINYIGLFAASISTFISYFVMSIYRYFDIQKYVKIRIDYKYILSILPIVFTSVLTYYFGSFYIKAIVLLSVIIVSYIFNKNLISQLINLILNKKKKKKY